MKQKSILIAIVFFFSFLFLINNLNVASAEGENFPSDYDVHFGLDNKRTWYEWWGSLSHFGSILHYQDYSADIFLYRAGIWHAPSGGENCEKCNDLGYACGDYQCHSLGTSCEIINKGYENEKCIWINEGDMAPPEISPLEKVLESGYKYIKTGAQYPKEYGVKIIYEADSERCIPPSKSITLGINTSEYSICKIDPLRGPSYDDMAQIMGHDFHTLEHVLTLPASAFPGEEAMLGAGFEIPPENTHDFFIRCKDYNGNINTATFDMEFCIQKGPETEAPVIEGTNAPVDGYVTFNVSNYSFEVYTDEPADCRWDFQDLDYERMNHNMSDCSYDITKYFSPGVYGCRTNLTGIQSGQENEYFVRCKDKPWWEPTMQGKRYSNGISDITVLIGTYPLQIDSITANGKETGSKMITSLQPLPVKLEVKTSAGANEGRSKCQYGIDGEYIDYFFNDGNFDFLSTHTQNINLESGPHRYDIKCRDEANNVVNNSINFTIEIDKTSPIVVRMYSEGSSLKLITNEDATCVYSVDSTTECNYDYSEGTELTTVEGVMHYVDWNTEMNLYIKCKDVFGNLPTDQNDCSIIARAFE